MGGVGLEGQIAQLVNDQELGPAELRQLLFKKAVVMTLGQHCHEGGRSHKLHRMVLPDCFSSQSDRQMRFPGPRWPRSSVVSPCAIHRLVAS